MGSLLHGTRGRWALLAAVALLGPAGARAADTETRSFTVYVEGKPSGTTTMTINRRDDGIIEMRCNTEVLVKVLLLKYRYSLQSREFWKDGKLLGFDCRANDNGKQLAVNGVSDGKQLHLKVNNQDRPKTRPDVWLTSYWNLPDAKRREQAIPIIDMDTGEELSGKLQFLGTQQMGVAGRATNVNHYRVNGTRTIDLWYDGSDRLVRQEFVDEGRKVIVVLTGIR